MKNWIMAGARMSDAADEGSTKAAFECHSWFPALRKSFSSFPYASRVGVSCLAANCLHAHSSTPRLVELETGHQVRLQDVSRRKFCPHFTLASGWLEPRECTGHRSLDIRSHRCLLVLLISSPFLDILTPESNFVLSSPN